MREDDVALATDTPDSRRRRERASSPRSGDRRARAARLVAASGALVATSVLLIAATAVRAQSPSFRFVPSGAERGIEPYFMASGMCAGFAAADYDDDGDVDLFVPNAQGHPDQLYRNAGDGTFQEIALESGLGSTDAHRGALWFDANGDRRLDLLVVGGDCEVPCDREMLTFYLQRGDGAFEDRTEAAGFANVVEVFDGQHAGGIAAGDLDGDHDLDVLVSFWQGEPYLFMNDGDGTFTERAEEAGLAGNRPHWQPVMIDVDADGWLDIFQAVDFDANILWRNLGDGTFVDIAAEAGVDNAMNDRGVAPGDFDGDGDLDFYVTNMELDGKHNVLLRNDSTGDALQFTEVARSARVHRGGCGWGCTFLDADNDGDLDLAATNGAAGGPHAADPSRFWNNPGGAEPVFDDVSIDVGFDDTDWAGGLVAFDADRDGDLDLAQACAAGGPLRLLDNRASPFTGRGHWIVVRPRSVGPNHRAIGAEVRVTGGGVTRRRWITAGTSMLSQEPAEAFFGLGRAASVDEITVVWPDGAVTVLHDQPADRVVTVVDRRRALGAR
jgi:hypothetical protein